MTKIRTKKLRILAAICATILPLFAYADNPGSGNNGTDIIICRNPNGGGRPKAPSRQNVACTYYAGTLSFSFAVPEGECVLSVTDLRGANSGVYVFDSTSGSAAVYVGPLEEASLEITTSQGNVYEGLLE